MRRVKLTKNIFYFLTILLLLVLSCCENSSNSSLGPNSEDKNPVFTSELPSIFEIDEYGEIIDFGIWIDTQDQVNNIPISGIMLGDTHYYNVNRDFVPEDEIYKLFVIPMGSMFGYPDEECLIKLFDSENVVCDSAVVLFQTNMAPDVVMPIDDIYVTQERFDIEDIDLDNHFMDNDSNIIYSVTFNPEEITASIIDNKWLHIEKVERIWGTVPIIVCAEDIQTRSISCFEFKVYIGPFFIVKPEEIFFENEYGVIVWEDDFYSKYWDMDFRSFSYNTYVDILDPDQAEADGFIVDQMGHLVHDFYAPYTPYSIDIRITLKAEGWNDDLYEVILIDSFITTLSFELPKTKFQ